MFEQILSINVESLQANSNVIKRIICFNLFNINFYKTRTENRYNIKLHKSLYQMTTHVRSYDYSVTKSNTSLPVF